MQNRISRLAALFVVAFSLVSSSSSQRELRPDFRVRRLTEIPPGVEIPSGPALTGAWRPIDPVSAGGRLDLLAGSGTRPAIMLTGYWPPSNEMLRHFSDDPTQNPGGWVGSDWEGRGYDVYAYFPEFANPNCSNCGQGTGDLEVDYQDTAQDFFALADALQPIAVITYSRGFNDFSWEVEMNQFNRSSWIDDFTAPFQPTPSPPDASVPADTLRPSALPTQAIVDAVDDSGIPVNPFICFTGDGGGYLSEFIAYHGVWYQALHRQPSDPAWCVAGGHVHVGGQIPVANARAAAEETLRTVIELLDEVTTPNAYCTPKTSSAGCVTLIGATNPTPVSGAIDTVLVAHYAQGFKNGLAIAGIGGPIAVPFSGGVLCVAPPLKRSQLLTSGGTSPVHCDGSFALLVNDTPFPAGFDPGPGNSAWYQWWYRDPGNGAGTLGTALSNGVRLDFQ